MSQVVQIESFSGEGIQRIEVTNQESFEAGGKEIKQLLTIALLNGIDNPLEQKTVVERVYNAYSKDLRTYVDNWYIFREAGLPVVPFLAQTERNTLLMSDLKADQSELYGKGYLAALDKNNLFRRMPVADKSFLELVTNEASLESIKKAVFRYTALANDKLIRLPYDDPYELIVHPNGEWELVILDLRYGEKFDPNSNPLHIDEAQVRNQEATERFINTLLLIQEQLRPTKKSLANKIKSLWW